jgi:hypothetical protein
MRSAPSQFAPRCAVASADAIGAQGHPLFDDEPFEEVVVDMAKARRNRLAAKLHVRRCFGFRSAMLCELRCCAIFESHRFDRATDFSDIA